MATDPAPVWQEQPRHAVCTHHTRHATPTANPTGTPPAPRSTPDPQSWQQPRFSPPVVQPPAASFPFPCQEAARLFAGLSYQKQSVPTLSPCWDRPASRPQTPRAGRLLQAEPGCLQSALLISALLPSPQRLRRRPGGLGPAGTRRRSGGGFGAGDGPVERLPDTAAARSCGIPAQKRGQGRAARLEPLCLLPRAWERLQSMAKERGPGQQAPSQQGARGGAAREGWLVPSSAKRSAKRTERAARDGKAAGGKGWSVRPPAAPMGAASRAGIQ